MDRIVIDFQNKYLGGRLAAELSRCASDAEIRLGSGDGFVLSDSTEPEYGLFLSDKYDWLPVSSLVRKIMKGMGKSLEPVNIRPLKQCTFIGFSSGCGGSGQSSSAIALGRIYSRLYGFKTVYVSFDRFSFGRSHTDADLPDLEKLVYHLMSDGSLSREQIMDTVSEDEYGLSGFRIRSGANPLCTGEFKYLYGFLLAIAESGLFERAVLDIPYNHVFAGELLSLCEKKIIVCGPDERSRVLSDTALAFFPGKKELLFHEQDEFSFDDGVVDIHGQFGAEVREIAEKIELY